MMQPPLVTVVCITYKQQQFLPQALEGIVSQITSFPFVVFVGVDCSNDGSEEIVIDYAQRYPDLIIPFLRESNMGAQHNLVDLCQRARSPYIAFCEGDDYWTDTKKLQKQFDIMEAHPEYRACFHDATVSIDTIAGDWFQEKDFTHLDDGSFCWPSGHKDFIKKDTYTLRDFLVKGFVQTSTMFYRWNYALNIPEWYYSHYVGDYTMWALQVANGEYVFLDESMSVYRIWDGGAYYFRSRYDLWSATKEDWLSIDQDLMSYLEATCVDAEIVDAARKRLSDDLAKLFSARGALYGRIGIEELIGTHQDLILQCYGIDVNRFPYSLSRFLLIAQIERKMHIPIRNRVLFPHLNRILVESKRKIFKNSQRK